MSDSDDEKDSDTVALTVADVRAQLPGPEKEISVVFKFQIA